MEFIEDAGLEVDIAAADAGDRGLREVEGFEGFFGAIADFFEAEPAGVDAGFLEVFGDGRAAMIGAEGDYVISAADGFIEVREKCGEVAIEAREFVLDFPTARAEGVRDIVERRKADAEVVGACAAAEMELVDGVGGEIGEIGLRVGAAFPFRVENRVGLGISVGAAEGMWESRAGAGGKTAPRAVRS